MGSLISGAARSLYGGNTSKTQQTQSSENRAFPWLQSTFSPVAQQGVNASSQLANLLGLNGQEAQTGGFDNWKSGTGFNFGLNTGRDAITGGAASKGLLNSGSTAKALMQFGQDYGSSKYNDYLSQLSGLLGQGLQAGNVVSGAGNVSQGQSTTKSGSSTGGFGGVVGKLLTKG